MVCKSLMFVKVTQGVLDNLKESLRQSGIEVPGGHMGLIKGKGITAEVYYWPQSEALRVTVLKKPWYASCGKVASKITKKAEAAGAERIIEKNA